MTTAVAELLNSFDALSDEERKDVTVELLRRYMAEDYGPLSDEDLTQLADDTLVELDAREAEDARGNAG